MADFAGVMRGVQCSTFLISLGQRTGLRIGACERYNCHIRRLKYEVKRYLDRETSLDTPAGTIWENSTEVVESGLRQLDNTSATRRACRST